MYDRCAEIIKKAGKVTAFTGAGISVESGIPPFRGDGGLWSTYDPSLLEINYFLRHPEESWKVIKEIFYEFFGKAKPNAAHCGLALMEEKGLLKAVITQNIDNLHQEAGSREVYEFHGTSQYLVCLGCSQRFHVSEVDLGVPVPACGGCGGLLKPDFVFFGEPIPAEAHARSIREAETADVFIMIGTTGEVAPASMIPHIAKRRGATIIEMNTEESNYTSLIADFFLCARATEAVTRLVEALGLLRGC